MTIAIDVSSEHECSVEDDDLASKRSSVSEALGSWQDELEREKWRERKWRERNERKYG